MASSALQEVVLLLIQCDLERGAGDLIYTKSHSLITPVEFLHKIQTLKTVNTSPIQCGYSHTLRYDAVSATCAAVEWVMPMYDLYTPPSSTGIKYQTTQMQTKRY